MRLIRGLATACVLAACVACNKDSEEVGASETQVVTPPQAAATPERVQGCLRAGEAGGTFVLTASAVDTRMDAATYQLLGEPDALRPHVGNRVEVTGTIVLEQAAQGVGARVPADDRAKGTSGTPMVQSTTEVEVKRLQVSGVTPVSGDCDDK